MSNSILTKKDLARYSLRYMFASQACWNYETQQSLGTVFAMGPLLEKIYADEPEKLKDKFQAYFQFFNCQTMFGAGINAGVLAFLRWMLIMVGYTQGAAFITDKREQLNNVRQAVSILGIIIVGALIAANVKVATPLNFAVGESTLVVQDILDKIMPKILSVGTVALVYKGLSIKKMNTIRMVWLIVVVSLVLALLGIIA